MRNFLFILLFLLGFHCIAQYTVKGNIYESGSLTVIPFANIVVNEAIYTTSDANGFYSLSFPDKGKYTITISDVAHKKLTTSIDIKKTETTKHFSLVSDNNVLNEFVLSESGSRNSLQKISITRLKAIEGTTINAGKKNEVIQLSKSTFNTATNNSRQIYAEVPGLNIWESDQTGLQLEIGARGLSPQRTSNFNTRQNYYDISADALGYPESYYTPPSEAVDRIQLIRGAASLQYGPQFGGMLNFIMKKGNPDKKAELTVRQSIGSYDLHNSFVSLGGQIKKTNYYVFGQYKTSGGWRPNSSLESYTVYGGLEHKFNEHTSLSLEYTRLFYTAQQPGGLTDQQFEDDPSQSNRSGNWFQVNWNVFALRLDHKFSTNTELSSQFFGLYAQRNALGYLQDISHSEDQILLNRDLILSTFQNFGNETKVLHRYKVKNHISAFLTGARYYQGYTIKDQGFGPDGKASDFEFNDKARESGSFYDFPSNNLSLFMENIFQINTLWSITPGIRYEYINTKSEGFTQLVGQNGEIVINNNSKDLERDVWLYGVGTSYKLNETIESYANFSKNYRAVNFNDLYTINTNIKIDENLSDESGYNIDIGLRGSIKNILTFDASAYYLKYADRIGNIIQVDTAKFQPYTFKTNISDSRTFGVEVFTSLDLNKVFNLPKEHTLRWFSNMTLQDGRYVNSSESSIEDKKVELVPNFNFKTGIIYKLKGLSSSLMYTYVGEQFSDATNTRIASQKALYGIIPSYQVVDLSLKYNFKKGFTLETGVNNLLDEKYFTRRATGYPGPGIVPSSNRNIYFSIEKKF